MGGVVVTSGGAAVSYHAVLVFPDDNEKTLEQVLTRIKTGEIISSRRFFDHDRSAGVSSDNAELIGLTERMLAEASAAGQLRALDLKQVQIAGRALVYGFARMHIDGHLPRWGVGEAEAGRMAADILDLFIAGITAPAAAEAKV